MAVHVWSTSIGCVPGDCPQSPRMLVQESIDCVPSSPRIVHGDWHSRDAWTEGSASVLGLSRDPGTPGMFGQKDLQVLAVSQDYPGIVHSLWYSWDVCVQGVVDNYWLCPGMLGQWGLQVLAVFWDCLVLPGCLYRMVHKYWLCPRTILCIILPGCLNREIYKHWLCPRTILGLSIVPGTPGMFVYREGSTSIGCVPGLSTVPGTPVMLGRGVYKDWLCPRTVIFYTTS